jgi:tetratricopeptide (TPR) repeat protein
MTSLVLFMRSVRSRTSFEEVISFCESSLMSSSTNEESWLVREQLAKACLDKGDIERAQELVGQLRKRFGAKSQRISLLEGLVLEAKGDWEKAKALYEDLVNRNANNSVAAKRLATVKRCQGDLDGCVKLLNNLIIENQSDPETWSELCDVQLVAGSYEAAAFCAEEVLLSNPHSYVLNTYFAEILFSCLSGNNGSSSNDAKWVEESRSYFSQSLVLNTDNNPRAAWGVLLCCSEESAKEAMLNAELKQKSALLLKKIYASSPMKDLVEPVLKQLSI